MSDHDPFSAPQSQPVPPAASSPDSSVHGDGSQGDFNPYNEVPYAAHSVPQMHPDHLAVEALLRGLSPAPMSRCRVLELGCADGSHLIPLAAQWPGSQFVGIDLAEVQVQRGLAQIRELGLTNIDLRAADLLTFEIDGEPFDYILCHGVYSWVPPRVQQRILQICQRGLSPDGLAYICYNLLPGFYRRQPVMEMMRYHVAGMTDPSAIVQQARALLSFLIDASPDPDSVGTRILREEAQRIGPLPDSYVFHEHFESDNQPCYFHTFMDAASAHGLQYVGDAVVTLGMNGLSPPAQQMFAQLGDDAVRKEQYMDFLRSSSLRSSILCPANRALCEQPADDVLQDLLVLGAAVPASLAPLQGDALRQPIAVRFHARLGEGQTDNPLFKALIWVLHRSRPRALSMPALCEQLSSLLQEPISLQQASQLALYAHRTGVCLLRRVSVPMHTQVSERPSVSLLSRKQARRDGVVTGPWHDPIPLDPFQQIVLPLLDGTRDIDAVLAAVLDAVASGALVVTGPAGSPAAPAELARDLRAQHLPKVLQTFAQLGLLVA